MEETLSKIKWYKRYPVDWLHGTRKLSLEERGAYADVIELIYSHDGNLEDDDEDIAGWLRCHLRKWRTIKARLIKMEKISVVNGFLVNNRCTSESVKALRLIQTCSKAGEKSGEIRRAKSLESNGYNEQMFTKTNEPTRTINQESERKKERLPYGSPKKESPSPAAQPPPAQPLFQSKPLIPPNGSPESNVHALQRKSGIDLEFNTFWNLYPRKEGKEKARQAYSRVRKTISDSVVNSAVVRYAEWIHRNDEPPQFIKHPTTWLNQGCWEDQLMDRRDRPKRSKTDEVKEVLERFNSRMRSNGKASDHNEMSDGMPLRLPGLQQEDRRHRDYS